MAWAVKARRLSSTATARSAAWYSSTVIAGPGCWGSGGAPTGRLLDCGVPTCTLRSLPTGRQGTPTSHRPTHYDIKVITMAEQQGMASRIAGLALQRFRI